MCANAGACVLPFDAHEQIHSRGYGQSVQSTGRQEIVRRRRRIACSGHAWRDPTEPMKNVRKAFLLSQSLSHKIIWRTHSRRAARGRSSDRAADRGIDRAAEARQAPEAKPKLILEKQPVGASVMLLVHGRVLNTPPINLARIAIPLDIADLLPRKCPEPQGGSCFRLVKLFLAMADPLNVLALDDVKASPGSKSPRSSRPKNPSSRSSTISSLPRAAAWKTSSRMRRKSRSRKKAACGGR